MKRFRYQSETITLAAAATAIDETKVTLDSAYEKMVGYAVYPKVQNAADSFNFGIIDNSGVLHDRTYEDDHISTTSIPHKDRYKDLEVEAAGHQITVQVEPTAALAGTLTIDVVFKLLEKSC